MRNSTVDVSARKTYDLLNEPAGRDYAALIDGSLAQCDTAVLTLSRDEPSPRAAAVLVELHPFSKGAAVPVAAGALQRYSLDRSSAEVLKTAVTSLYGWCRPAMPADLCLLRADGSPWLVSIAGERLGYVELTPFEKLLLGRGSPTMSHMLAHQGARDAVLAVFERGVEAAAARLHDELRAYAETAAAEGREGLVDAMRDWLESDEQMRITVAIDFVAEFGLHELHDDIAGMRDAVLRDGELAPRVYGRSVVLRDRWRARHIRQLDRALRLLHDGAVAGDVDGADATAGAVRPAR